MGKIYCLKCNFSNEYGAVMPNFCGKCGKPFIEKSHASSTQPIKQPIAKILPYRERHQESEDVEYPEDATSVPNIDKVEFILNVKDFRPNRENGKELFNQGSPSDAAEVLSRKRNTSKAKISKSQEKAAREKVKEEFRNQLSSSGRKSRESTEIGG